VAGVVSLCGSCHFVREVVTGKGSRFLLCRKSLEDARFAKYPPQPIAACGGYLPKRSAAADKQPALRDSGDAD
jgi:hypothetical protein